MKKVTLSSLSLSMCLFANLSFAIDRSELDNQLMITDANFVNGQLSVQWQPPSIIDVEYSISIYELDAARTLVGSYDTKDITISAPANAGTNYLILVGANSQSVIDHEEAAFYFLSPTSSTKKTRLLLSNLNQDGSGLVTLTWDYDPRFISYSVKVFLDSPSQNDFPLEVFGTNGSTFDFQLEESKSYTFILSGLLPDNSEVEADRYYFTVAPKPDDSLIDCVDNENSKLCV
ncbi:hypothetical protein [Enterovibrio norvegicus]|uniref:hypothetical protein n=1 Tax=Enterovibrio norvegicus TaxID=188144 RepID=UPI00352DEFF9